MWKRGVGKNEKEWGMRRLGPILLTLRTEEVTEWSDRRQPVEAGKGQEKDSPIKLPKSSQAHALILVQ